MSYFQNRGLVNALNDITRNWETIDYFKARASRSWDKFDRLSESEKLMYRLREAKEYNQGYLSDDDGWQE